MALRPRKRVGIIGLGIIGSRVAAGLRAGGYQVFVWNRTPRREPNFLGSPAELAKVCPVLQLFVADGEALVSTVESFAGELTKDHVVLGHATVAPESALEAARIVKRTGAEYLDAPFTGSRLAADSRQLVYYVGGKPEVLERVRGVLMGSAKLVLKTGEIGQASAVKIATNMVTAASIEAMAEGLALIQHAGIDPKCFFDAMANNANYSPAIALKLPKMIAEEFEPHFSMKHMFKDLHLALRMADGSGMKIPATETVADVLFESLKQGWGDLDFSAVMKRYLPETPENHEEPSVLAPETHVVMHEPEPSVEMPVSSAPVSAPAEAETPTPKKMEAATAAQTPLVQAALNLPAEKVEAKAASELGAPGNLPEPKEKPAEPDKKPVETKEAGAAVEAKKDEAGPAAPVAEKTETPITEAAEAEPVKKRKLSPFGKIRRWMGAQS